MKRKQKLSWLFALVLLAGSTQSFSQTIKDFFSNNSTPLTYLGIDYYRNRIINQVGISASDMKSRYYEGMNDVVVNEMEKNYKIGEAFNRAGSSVTVDISAVTDRNGKVDVKDIGSSSEADFNRLTEADIASEIKALSLKDKSGIGLVFIMEGMKKDDKKGFGSVWVVLVDMKTKKVLMNERMEQEAAGFSPRNYWVSVIKRSIVDIEKKSYKKWKNKYGS